MGFKLTWFKTLLPLSTAIFCTRGTCSSDVVELGVAGFVILIDHRRTGPLSTSKKMGRDASPDLV